MQNMTPSTYLAVLQAKDEELSRKTSGQIYSEFALEICESWLRMFEPPLMTTFVDRSVPKGDLV